MSSTANAQSNNDPWSLSSNTNDTYTVRCTRAIKQAKRIPDAWDDDDDANEEKEEDVDNAAVWRDANAKPPMPEVILTTSSTSSSAAPPPAALQQPMRILKRPSTSSSSSATSIDKNDATTLKDREAAYQAARARIFGLDSRASATDSANAPTHSAGDGTAAGTLGLRETQERLKAVNLNLSSKPSSTSPSPTPSTSVSASILRNPHGPPSASTSTPTSGSSSPDKGSANQKGFSKRRGGGGKARGGSTPSNTASNVKS